MALPQPTYRFSGLQAPDLSKAAALITSPGNMFQDYMDRKAKQERQTILDEQAKQLFDLKMSEARDLKDREYATQEAAKALFAPEAYTKQIIAGEQAGIAESMANLQPSEQEQLKQALAGYTKSIAPINGKYAGTERGQQALASTMFGPNVDMLALQKAMPKTGTPAKESELEQLVKLFGKEKAAELKYKSKDKPDKAKLATYTKATQAIGKLGNAEEVGELWRQAGKLGVQDRFIEELGVAGAYDPTTGWLDFDIGAKDIDTKRLKAVIKEASATLTPPTAKDSKLVTKPAVDSPIQQAIQRLAKPAGQVQDIQNEIKSLREGGIFSTPKIESYIKSVIDKEYGAGTYDKYK